MLHSRTWLTRTGIAAVALGLTAALAVPAASASPTAPAPSSIPAKDSVEAQLYDYGQMQSKATADAIMADVRAMDALDGKRNITHKLVANVVAEWDDVRYHKGKLTVFTNVEDYYFRVNLKKGTATRSKEKSWNFYMSYPLAQAIASEAGTDLSRLAEATDTVIGAYEPTNPYGAMDVRVEGNLVYLSWDIQRSGYVFEFSQSGSSNVFITYGYGVVKDLPRS